MALAAFCGLGLTACSSGQTAAAKATIRGVLLQEPGGGAAPGTLPHPMAGIVLIEFNYLDALKAIIMTVGTNGRFSRSVVPGTYTVVPGQKTGCLSTPVTIHVRAGKVVTVAVNCGSSIG
jgi:hypothetical protein